MVLKFLFLILTVKNVIITLRVYFILIITKVRIFNKHYNINNSFIFHRIFTQNRFTK